MRFLLRQSCNNRHLFSAAWNGSSSWNTSSSGDLQSPPFEASERVYGTSLTSSMFDMRVNVRAVAGYYSLPKVNAGAASFHEHRMSLASALQKSFFGFNNSGMEEAAQTRAIGNSLRVFEMKKIPTQTMVNFELSSKQGLSKDGSVFSKGGDSVWRKDVRNFPYIINAEVFRRELNLTNKSYFFLNVSRTYDAFSAGSQTAGVSSIVPFSPTERFTQCRQQYCAVQRDWAGSYSDTPWPMQSAYHRLLDDVSVEQCESRLAGATPWTGTGSSSNEDPLTTKCCQKHYYYEIECLDRNCKDEFGHLPEYVGRRTSIARLCRMRDVVVQQPSNATSVMSPAPAAVRRAPADRDPTYFTLRSETALLYDTDTCQLLSFVAPRSAVASPLLESTRRWLGRVFSEAVKSAFDAVVGKQAYNQYPGLSDLFEVVLDGRGVVTDLVLIWICVGIMCSMVFSAFIFSGEILPDLCFRSVLSCMVVCCMWGWHVNLYNTK